MILISTSNVAVQHETYIYVCVSVCDSSMVIRDLTLRSAASFGSFHLIRLLYDEYMFYIIEHKVATAMQETSIAVMADYRQVGLNNTNN